MTSERSIPHLRDIFGLGSQAFHHHHYNELARYPHQQKDVPAYDDENKKSKKSGGSNKKSSKKDNYKTLTSGDVKTLERHLSMKKTIRKKIMRDLSQAFVEDPNEFKIENSTPEQLKAELSAEAMKFGEKHNRRIDSNFLDMLRGDSKASTKNKDDREDYSSVALAKNEGEDHQIDPSNNEKTSFWRRLTMKNKNKR